MHNFFTISQCHTKTIGSIVEEYTKGPLLPTVNNFSTVKLSLSSVRQSWIYWIWWKAIWNQFIHSSLSSHSSDMSAKNGQRIHVADSWAWQKPSSGFKHTTGLWSTAPPMALGEISEKKHSDCNICGKQYTCVFRPQTTSSADLCSCGQRMCHFEKWSPTCAIHFLIRPLKFLCALSLSNMTLSSLCNLLQAMFWMQACVEFCLLSLNSLY